VKGEIDETGVVADGRFMPPCWAVVDMPRVDMKAK
jgi:hypothetical protein